MGEPTAKINVNVKCDVVSAGDEFASCSVQSFFIPSIF